MDFSDLSSYPMVANTDYSPTQEAFSYPDTFDKAYLADSYSTQPDYSLDTFFDLPVNSIEQPSNSFAPSSPTARREPAFNTVLPAATNSYQTTAFNPAPFGRIDSFPSSGFPFDPVSTGSFENTELSPRNATSPTPSLCGDGPQIQPASPSLSPRSLKRESPEESADISLFEPASKRPQRKRGRPRLDRSETSSVSAYSPTTASTSNRSSKQSHRLPHNQVERKYREGLNSELERLRKAVPTLPQSDEAGVMGQPKPSKAMVLAGAIEYIRKIERERDAALEEVERLRATQMPNYGPWGKREDIDFNM